MHKIEGLYTRAKVTRGNYSSQSVQSLDLHADTLRISESILENHGTLKFRLPFLEQVIKIMSSFLYQYFQRRLLLTVFHLNPLMTPLTLNLRGMGHSQVQLYFSKMPLCERLTLSPLIYSSLIHSITIASHFKKKTLIMVLQTRGN